jgi:hypothetical protein
MKRKDGKAPYDGYWIYGPIFNSSSGRNVVVLIDKVSKLKTSLSYARYLKSVQLGRKLGKDECVDHVDENKRNDDVNNLQILSRSDNNAKHRRIAGIKPIRFKFRCPICRKVFVREKRMSHIGKRGILTTCSRSCSGKARALMGHGFDFDISDNVIGIVSDP